MERGFLERIRGSLLDRRHNLVTWLEEAAVPEKQVLLGPASEEAVHAHLHTIDSALERAAAQTLGRCEVCNEFVGENLLEMDYTACVCIDHFSADQIRDLERELELAQGVQRTLLPRTAPDTPGLEIAAFSRPAQIVGGDYYDFLRYQHGAHGLAIGDVAGHGVSASLHMASVQTLLRTLVPQSGSPVEVVRRVGDVYMHNIQFPTFVTLFLGAVDTSSSTLTYCNAGHNPPFVLRQGHDGQASVFWLGPTGPAVGLVEGFEFRQEAIDLQPGDTLLLYTDGIIEAASPRGELFGRQRLVELVGQWAGLPAGDLIQLVLQEVARFTAGKPAADDVTMMVYKVAEG